MCQCLDTVRSLLDQYKSNDCLLIAAGVASIVGLLVLLKIALKIGGGLLCKLTASSKLSKYRREDSWAVVTGATDGIGQAFAADLYQKGWNVLIVSRTESKLQEVIKTDLSGKGKAASVCIDFTNANEHDYARLKTALAGKDVGLLVNNVGVGYPNPEYFHLIDDKLIRDLIRVNIEATMFVTRTVLPFMLNQKRGLVVSISSGSSITPTCPLLSVYAASKAYLNNWTPSMNSEYNNQGIFFETLTPFYITSKLSKFRRPTMTIPTPKAYVKSVMSSIGTYSLHTGFWAHTAMACLLNCVFPLWFAKKYMTGLHLKARALALKKAAAKKE